MFGEFRLRFKQNFYIFSDFPKNKKIYNFDQTLKKEITKTKLKLKHLKISEIKIGQTELSKKKTIVFLVCISFFLNLTCTN